MKLLLLLATAGLLTSDGASKDEARSAEADVRSLIGRAIEGWERGDGDAFAAPFTEDADFVTFGGDHLKGRPMIASLHQHLFDTVLKGSRLRGEIQGGAVPEPRRCPGARDLWDPPARTDGGCAGAGFDPDIRPRQPRWPMEDRRVPEHPDPASDTRSEHRAPAPAAMILGLRRSAHRVDGGAATVAGRRRRERPGHDGPSRSATRARSST